MRVEKSGPESPVCASMLTKNFQDDAVLKKGSLLTSARTKGFKNSDVQSGKKYLGVRVRMPVKDMLRKIRISQGMDIAAIQDKPGRASKATGEKKRVTSSGDRRNRLKKQQINSLEDLAIIVEVLDEDLKASKLHRHLKEGFWSTVDPELQEKSWGYSVPCQNFLLECSGGNETPPPEKCNFVSELCSVRSRESAVFSPGPPYSTSIVSSPSTHGEYHSDDSEDRFYCPPPYTACTRGDIDYQDDCFLYSPHSLCDSDQDSASNFQGFVSDKSVHDWNGMHFFKFQLQREGNLLRSVSDEQLLTLDITGSTLLHNAVIQGKRALVYVTAERMVALNQLDIKDSEGKTALHLAAQRNQHLMVADLLYLGANVNEKDKFGKTCLHLSAENGYIRVLEVLKGSMNEGIYVDVGATDANGLNVLQSATVALNWVVRELESCVTPSQARFNTLRKEQLIETLECLLQMETCVQFMENARNPQTAWGPHTEKCASNLADLPNNMESLRCIQKSPSNFSDIIPVSHWVQ